MTGLVSRAEKRGPVLRERSPHDGRGVLVALTPDRSAGRTDGRIVSRRLVKSVPT
jgi:DNA-binding MarR family transcriptional regulator